MLYLVEIIFDEIVAIVFLNVLESDFDVIVTVSSWLLVKYSNSVHQFVLHGRQVDAAVAQWNILSASLSPNITVTSLIKKKY